MFTDNCQQYVCLNISKLFRHYFEHVFSLFLFLSTFTLKDLGQDSNVILSFQAGVTPLMQEQLQQLARQKLSDHQGSSLGKKGKLVVIGQDCMDALQALRSAGEEVD